MAEGRSSRNYRLELKKGDFISATIEGVDSDGLWVDPSPWSNIETMIVEEVGENTAISPGSDIYAEVTDITDTIATLSQRQGIYRRNHQPGDTLRVQCTEQVNSTMCRGRPERLRNLDTLYLIGVSVCADVTAEIEKIRNGAAFAFPTTVHDPGLVSGRAVEVETTAGSREADVVAISDYDSGSEASIEEVPVELTEPAPVTGTVSARITDIATDKRVAELEEGVVDVTTGETFETTVSSDHAKISVSLPEDELAIEVSLDHGCPCDGIAIIELTDREDWVYRGEVIEYTDPQIETGVRYRATVIADDNKARVERKWVKLVDDISKTGKASVRITELSDEIYGQVEGEIERTLGNDTESDSSCSSDIDITDVSKL